MLGNIDLSMRRFLKEDKPVIKRKEGNNLPGKSTLFPRC